MANDECEIPFIGRIEDSGLPLVVTRTPSGSDRRIEEWIASNLDLESDPSKANHWNQLIANLPVSQRMPSLKANDRPAAGTPNGWSRFNIAYKRGITVVRLVDRALVDQAHIQEMGADLMDLIEVGNHRLVLNFTLVERLGSWIIGVVGTAHRRCAAGDGGKLKICGLDPRLAEIFSIVGMASGLDFHAAEADAIDSPWPLRLAPRQLPVDILSTLLAMGGIPPLRGGAPDDEAEVADLHRHPEPAYTERIALASSTPAASVSLGVRVGASDSRTVIVSIPRFLIGRDRSCHLRLGSAQVSKQHATLEQRDGRVYLRDLGSTNGTLINGRLIRDLEVDIRNGDQFQIGPVLATLQIGLSSENSGPTECPILEWVGAEVEAPTLLAPLTEAPGTEELSLIEDLDLTDRIKFEILEEVLVITPRLQELEDEATLAIRGTPPAPCCRQPRIRKPFVSPGYRPFAGSSFAPRLEWWGAANLPGPCPDHRSA
jgi:anti-anti-sigma regulatory factor